MTRIVAISDTHEYHKKLKIPDGDILICSGDFTGRGSIPAINNFNAWLGTLPHINKLVIAGNHDWLFQTDPSLAQSLITNAIYLQDSSVKIDELNFYGTPWTPNFYNWAFMTYSSQEARAKYDNIPMDTDVLITHGPPHGFGDMLIEDFKTIYVGCPELLKAVERVKPKVHIFGHIHEGYGEYQYGSTKLINASSCDGNYRPVNAPIVIDL